MRVANLLGHKNQFIIYDDQGNIGFQSYSTLMAKVFYASRADSRQLNMESNFWSATTGRHMAEFLRVTHLMSAVNTLIENKIFRNLKDFMQNTDLLLVSKYSICVRYTNKKGIKTEFVCSVTK